VFEPTFESPTSWTHISSATKRNAQENWLYIEIKRKINSENDSYYAL